MIKFSDSGGSFDITMVNCIVCLKIKWFFLKTKITDFFRQILRLKFLNLV